VRGAVRGLPGPAQGAPAFGHRLREAGGEVLEDLVGLLDGLPGRVDEPGHGVLQLSDERVEVAVRQEGAAGTVVRVRSVPVPRTGTGEGVGARAGAAVVERGGAGARPGVRGGVAGGPPGAGHRVAAARGPRTAGVATEAVAVAVETVGGVTVETVGGVTVDGLGARGGGPLAAEVVAAPGELVQGPAGGVGHRS